MLSNTHFFICPECGCTRYGTSINFETKIFTIVCHNDYCNFKINYKTWCLQNLDNKEWVKNNNITPRTYEDLSE